MRIYCLSKTEEIPPEDNPLEECIPYEDGADETEIPIEEYNFPEKIKKYISRSRFYGLTEISIGYLENQGRKVFAMYIYRRDFGLHKIRMTRGAIRLQKIADDVYDLFIANSKIYPKRLHFDLRTRLRCIKNTSTKGIITVEEEKIYYEYEEQIENCCDYNANLQEKVFEKLKFTKHNTTTKKVYKERISNFSKLIDYLCDPKTGSYKNVPTSNTRLYQEVENFLSNQYFWFAKKPRINTLDKQAKNFRGCTSIKWLNADVSKLTLQDVSTKKLRKLHFEEVNFFDSKGKIQECFKYFDLKNLEELSLFNCNILELTKEFFEKLPATLRSLNVQNNKIIQIDEEIVKLGNLEKFDLFNNASLSDEGIPWKKLPPTIKYFDLGYTNIIEIPSDIQRLTNLITLNVSSEKLTRVDWKAVSLTVQSLEIKGGGTLNEINLTGKDQLKSILVNNAGLINVDCSLFPPSVEALDLCNNKLEHFDTGPYLPNLDQLALNNNNLKSLEWKNLPSSLNYLIFDNNDLVSIDDVSHLINLIELTANFNHIRLISENIRYLRNLFILQLRCNEISELPFGFKHLVNLRSLDLSKNHFNFTKNNLEDALWRRLPTQNYIDLFDLNHNVLGELPCILQNIPIEHLHVEDCKIQHICPHLFVKSHNFKNNPLLNIRFNPIHFLPFIPIKIFQPLSKEEIGKPVNNVHPEVYSTTRLHLSMNDDRFVVTSKFPVTVKKPKYEFKNFEAKKDGKLIEPNFCCKCCAKCGIENEVNVPDFPIIEQLMVMDYVLSFDQIFKEPVRILAGKKQKKESLNLENCTNVGTRELFYCAGKWKTNVVTRLCNNCIILMKDETDKAFEIFKNSLPNDEEIFAKKTREGLIAPQIFSIKPTTMKCPAKAGNLTATEHENIVLLLSNKFEEDCFLNSAVNVIDVMAEFKASICSNFELSVANATHRKLIEVLHREIPHVRDLRQTMPQFRSSKQEDAGEALLALINAIDNESRKFINFSYKTVTECPCKIAVQECLECPILHLTVFQNAKNTFNSMLEQWQFSSVRCPDCCKMASRKNFVDITEDQQYLIVELGSWITQKDAADLHIPISLENFCEVLQEIFNHFWDLIGAIQHIGNASGGHYISWRKHGKKWIVINDDTMNIVETLLQDFRDYKILIFQKIPIVDIDLDGLRFESSADLITNEALIPVYPYLDPLTKSMTAYVNQSSYTEEIYPVASSENNFQQTAYQSYPALPHPQIQGSNVNQQYSHQESQQFIQSESVFYINSADKKNTPICQFIDPSLQNFQPNYTEEHQNTLHLFPNDSTIDNQLQQCQGYSSFDNSSYITPLLISDHAVQDSNAVTTETILSSSNSVNESWMMQTL